MTPKQLSELLARDAEAVAVYLLPNGKRIGHEWRCGSLAGDAGDSMGVHLRGDKSGIWCDFATGEKGDLIDLWREVRGCANVQAMNEAADWLGVTLDKKPVFAKREKVYAAPKTAVPPAEETSAVVKYLTKERLISIQTITAFKISQSQKGAIFFPFYNPDGELVMVKYRSITEKRIGVTEKDMKPTLFGWQAVSQSSRAIVICEGEIDAMSFAEYGIPALSVPFGGGGGAKQDWIEHEYDNLQRFDDIYLAMDMDDEGRKAVAEIIDRLGRHRCKVVELPFKDANECLLNAVAKADLWKTLTTAKTIDPTELRNASEYLSEILAAFTPTESEQGFFTPWDKCKELRFRPGEVTLIAGVNGHGKSEAVGHLTIDAIAQGQKACIASMEFKPHKWLARIVRQTAATDQPTPAFITRAVEWLEPALWVFDVATTAKTDRMLEVFQYARQRYGITLFVIDNLSKLNIGLDDYDGQRAFVDKLTDFAKQHDVHVFLVAHLRKGEDDGKPGGKFDVKGSGAITDLVDTVLIWWRNRKKEEKLKRFELSDADRAETERLPDAMCVCEKQRNGEDEPRISLWWHGPSHQFLPTANHPPREYVPWQ